MLKKIGNIYVDPEEISAVELANDCLHPALYLRAGSVIVVDAEEDELLAFLRDTELLPDTRAPEAFIELTDEERDELLHFYAIGCVYIARDKDGKAWAYRRRPELRGFYWEGGDDPEELLARYDFLEAGGEEPMDILALLAGGE